MTTSPVTTLTDELIAELELLTSKATQGNWWIDSHGHTMIAEDTLDIVFSMPSTKGAIRHPETGNLSSWRNDWDASYIATANPKNMQTLLGELRRLRAENAELKRDAERYRWLIKCTGSSIAHLTLGSSMFSDEDIDAAIDAAMQN